MLAELMVEQWQSKGQTLETANNSSLSKYQSGSSGVFFARQSKLTVKVTH